MLDDNKRHQLSQVVSSPGYQVILDLMEQECDKAERELLQANPAMVHEVVARHATARAYRESFERFQRTVQIELSQQTAEVEVKPSAIDIMKWQLENR